MYKYTERKRQLPLKFEIIRDTATMENSMEFPEKLKLELPYDPANRRGEGGSSDRFPLVL